ncbi:MAG TPA: sigma-70 family RNA polymerase sigma factor [Spirochaetota bacterium]|nr:sigma-70 family RNA polymerase sigma factor [Spirochaetota bacterium]
MKITPWFIRCEDVIMYNPFKEVINEEQHDRDLIEKSLGGDGKALESLILRHQSWIYNIALRMYCDPVDAEDVTQEVLVKMITKLATYDPYRAAFRTWLYRIVANHIINRNGTRMESLISDIVGSGDFEKFASQVPDKRRWTRPESELIRDEIKMSCIHCMLLCLNRRERMVFILGAIFGVDDVTGGEICGTTRANFRKILSRTRARLYGFFSRQCSLLNENNPCRCSDRLKSMVRLELIDPDRPRIAGESFGPVEKVIHDSVANLEDAYYEFHALFRSQPFFKSPDMALWLREQLNREDIRALFQIQ